MKTCQALRQTETTPPFHVEPSPLPRRLTVVMETDDELAMLRRRLEVKEGCLALALTEATDLQRQRNLHHDLAAELRAEAALAHDELYAVVKGMSRLDPDRLRLAGVVERLARVACKR